MSNQKNYFNTLKTALNAALFGGRPVASVADRPAEAEGVPPVIDPAAALALSGLSHFRIPTPDPPGEGWVYVGDGEMKRADKLTDYERKREALLAPLARRAIELYLALAQLKADWHGAFDEVELLNVPNNTRRVQKGKKPSLTLYLLDRSIALTRQRSDVVRYEDDIVLRAKDLIDGCFEEWTGEERTEIQQIAEIAFSKNVAGQYSRSSLLRLRRIQSKNPDWKRAMEIIKEAEIPDGMASYLVAKVRDGQGKFHPIPLDMAAVREWQSPAGTPVLKAVRPIRSESDYKAAQAEINILLALRPDTDSPEGERLEVLVALASDWNVRHLGNEF